LRFFFSTIGVSLSYLEQLAANLRRSGLITGFKGPRGGYTLAKPVYEISVLDIVLSAEDRASGRGNEVDDGYVSEKPQGQELWDQLEKSQYLLLQRISLADVVSGNLRNHPLLKSVFTVLA